MAERKASAEWNGSLKEGSGKMTLGSGVFEGAYSFGTRMGDEPGTNPEELIAAALAGCYVMALNATLEKQGTPARNVKASATVHFGKDDGGFKIARIDLATETVADGLTDEDFQMTAENVKETCPVSKALAAVDIRLEAKLVKTSAA